MKQIRDRLQKFDTDMAENYFGIFGRHYIVTAALLTYCSVLKFYLQDRLLPRGWMDILIMGDTRCGKSALVEGVVRHIRMGEFFKCENSSFAGLVGGLQQIGSRARWDIIWGKIPLNHGKLLVADEMSSLSVGDISDMSAVRSSGIAEVTKIQSGSTRSATRIIWISNPRSERPMNQYTYGIHAVRELIGRPEDISRFDFVIGVASEDVPVEIINQKCKPVKYEAHWDELRQLVRWVWQLRPNEVVITPEATDAILSLAKGQSSTYSNAVPIVEPNEQRVRLARVAVATAARCFSEEGGRLVVKQRHVEFADWFMRSCFDSKALGYGMFSAAEHQTETENEECMKEVTEVLTRYTDKSDRAVRLLYASDMFATTDVEHIFNVPRPEAREIISVLLRFGCVHRKHQNYAKTKIGISVLERFLKGRQSV